MHDDADELESTSLHVNQEQLRAFNAKQKLRATVYALIGLNRLQYNGEMPPLVEADDETIDSRRTDISVDSRRTEEMSVDPESEEEEDAEYKESEHYEIPTEREDIFIINKNIPLPPLLREETKKQAKDYREKYHEKQADLWIEKFMKNNNYNIKCMVK